MKRLPERARALAALVALAAALPTGTASAADVNPPTRWWEVGADRFLEPIYLAHTRKNPQNAAAAKQALQSAAARIDQYRAGVKAKLDEHAAKRMANLKLRFSDPATRTAWNDWKAQDRTLYEPIHNIIREFDASLNGAAPPAADGTSTTPTVPVAPVPTPANPSPGGPTSSPSDSDPWASKDYIETHLGSLPPLTTEVSAEALRKRAETVWGGPLPTDEKTAGRLDERIRKTIGGFQKYAERHGSETERLREAVRLVRSNPLCIRQSDVQLIRAHWMELVDAATRSLANFDEDVQKTKN